MLLVFNMFLLPASADNINDSASYYFSYNVNTASDIGGLSEVASSGQSDTGTNCIQGHCRTFLGSGSYIDYGTPFSYSDSWSIIGWLNPDTGSTERATYTYWMGLYSGAGTGLFNGHSDPTFDLGLTNAGGTNAYFIAAWDIPETKTTMITYVWDETTNLLTIFYNDTVGYNSTLGTETFNLDNLKVGASDSLGQNEFDGTIDEIWIFDEAIPFEWIEAIFDGGDYCNPYNETCLASSQTPALSLSSNFDDTINRSLLTNPDGQLYFNVTAAVTNNSYIYDGNISVNDTALLNFTDINFTNNVTLNFSFEELEGQYNVTITVFNENATDQLSWLIWIDGISPEVTTDVVNETTYTNYNGTPQNFSKYVQAIDTLLDGLNYTIYDRDSLFILFTEEIYGVNESAIKFNISIDLDNFTFNVTENGGVQNWSLNATAWDSHNPKKEDHEKAKNITSKMNYIDFEFNGGNIKIEGVNADQFVAEDRENKYKVSFKAKKLGLDILTITSDKTIRIINRSVHQGHVMIRGLEKYVDLDSSEMEVLKLVQVTDKRVDAYVEYHDTAVKTKSLGDLNIVSVIYDFQVELINVVPDNGTNYTDCRDFIDFKDYEYVILDDNPQYIYMWVYNGTRVVDKLDLVITFEDGTQMPLTYNDAEDRYDVSFNFLAETEVYFNITENITAADVDTDYCGNIFVDGIYHVYDNSFQTCIYLYSNQNATKSYSEIGYVLMQPTDEVEINFTTLDYLTGYVWTRPENNYGLDWLDVFAWDYVWNNPSLKVVEGGKWFIAPYDGEKACLDLYFPDEYKIKYIVGDLRTALNYGYILYNWKDVDVTLSTATTVTNSTNIIKYYVTSWDVNTWANIRFFIIEFFLVIFTLICFLSLLTISGDPWGSFKVAVVLFIIFTILHMLILGVISGIEMGLKIIKYIL